MLREIGYGIPDLMVDTTTSGGVITTGWLGTIEGVGDRGLRCTYLDNMD